MGPDLRELLATSAGDPGPPPDWGKLIGRARRRRQRRRVAVGLTVILVAGGVGAAVARPDHQRGTLVQGADKPRSDPPAVRPGSWRSVAVGKSGVLSPHVFWTGDRVLAFYEATYDQSLVDGELYDPGTDRARPINRGFLHWRGGAAVVWTGRELIVWGGGSELVLDQEGGAYNPATDRWRSLARAPVAAGPAGEAAWTGTEMVVPARALAYNPAVDRWRRITPSPLGPRHGGSIVWTGREVIAWSGCDLESVQCDGGPSTASTDGAAYDPRTDRWRRLPPSPLSRRQAPQAVWTGTEMIIWGGHSFLYGEGAWSAAYNPTANAWRPLPKSPLPPRSDVVQVWTGREMLVWGGLSSGSGDDFVSDGASYDPASNRWSLLPRSPLSPRDGTGSVWTGQDLFIVGGYPGEGSAAFMPTG